MGSMEPRKEKSEEKEKFDLDDNLLLLGNCGFYPFGIYLIALFLIFMCPAQYMTAHIASLTPPHHCKIDNDSLVNESIPWTIVNGKPQLSECERFADISSLSNPGNNASTIPCDRGWHYVDAVPGESIVSEWDLVCDKSWVPEFSTSMFNVGQALGGLFVQPLGDFLGRRKMIVVSLVGTILTGLFVGTVVEDVVAYIILRAINGLFYSAYVLMSFVIVIEIFAAKYRMMYDMIAEVVWGFGAASIAFYLYLFPQWRHFTIFISVPLTVGFIFIFFFPPDTLPWLMANGRQEEVRDYLKSKFESKGLTMVYLTPAEVEAREREQQAGTAAAAVDSPRRMMTNFRVLIQLVILAFVSLVNSLVFYALSLMSTGLSGDKHVNLFLAGIVEVPGYALAGLSLHFMGRRGPTFFFHVIVGVCLASVVAINVFGPESRGTGLNAVFLIFYFGAKFGISGSYAIVFLFTPEIFPTNIRNTSLGIVDSVARLGGVLAPFSSSLAEVYPSLPAFLFSILAFIAAGLVLFLPESHNQKLPDSLADLETLYSGTRFWSMTGKRHRPRKTDPVGANDRTAESFFLYGANQLEVDFRFLRDWLDEKLNSTTVRRAIFDLEVFAYIRGVCACLSRQPPAGGGRKVSRGSPSRREGLMSISGRSHRVCVIGDHVQGHMEPHSSPKGTTVLVPPLADRLSPHLTNGGAINVRGTSQQSLLGVEEDSSSGVSPKLQPKPRVKTSSSYNNSAVEEDPHAARQIDDADEDADLVSSLPDAEDWLALRVVGGARRWSLPNFPKLKCFSAASSAK